jgi:undecaprenyl-diphosphatase
MDDIIHALILGLLQGFTEFLPVSSSAHLILLPKLMGWKDFGLAFDIAIHTGSLIAILSYFWRDRQFKASFLKLDLYKLLGLIVVATIPVGLAGLLFKHYVAINLRSVDTIVITTILFGVLLGVGYYYYIKHNKHLNVKQLSFKLALLIGCAQAIAIIPGVSRSGVTLTAGLLLGLDLFVASRFSFVLAIPVIILAGGKQLVELIMANQLLLNIPILLSGFLSSAITSYGFVFLFFKYLRKIGMWPFVIYRILLGTLLCLISC